MSSEIESNSFYEPYEPQDHSSLSSSLLEAIRTHDTQAWQELFDQYGAQVYGWCRASQLSEDDAIDMTQETLAAVYRSIDNFEREYKRQSFHKWIQTITLNKVRDHYRMQQRVHVQSVGESSWNAYLASIAEQADHELSSAIVAFDKVDEREQAVEQVRLETSGRDWAIFEQLSIGERTAQEVAAQFGTTRNAVYLVKSKILKRVRECLADRSPRETE